MNQTQGFDFQQRSLYQQGYQSYSSEELTQMKWGLRFTPSACTAMTITALALQLPWLALVVSALGIWAFYFPAAHPMDLIYNHGVRHVIGAVKLPPNPLQRRLACLSAGVMNFMVGIAFLLTWNSTAYVIGGILVVLQLIVITTHFCMLSWFYEMGMRMLGKWSEPISSDEALQHVQNGAQIIDVRDPSEFADKHLKNAINVPVDTIEQEADKWLDKAILVYCASGFRSQIALQKFQQHGHTRVFDMGNITQCQETFGIE